MFMYVNCLRKKWLEKTIVLASHSIKNTSILKDERANKAIHLPEWNNAFIRYFTEGLRRHDATLQNAFVPLQRRGATLQDIVVPLRQPNSPLQNVVEGLRRYNATLQNTVVPLRRHNATLHGTIVPLRYYTLLLYTISK